MKKYILDSLKTGLKNQLGDWYMGLVMLSNLDSSKNDLDFVVLLNNNASKFEAIKMYSDFAVNMTQELKIFISIYPILESELSTPNNTFLKNVKANLIYV